MAVNGTPITKYGTAIRITSAQTSVPLLGGDFLAHHGLIVLSSNTAASPIQKQSWRSNPGATPSNSLSTHPWSTTHHTNTRLTGSVTSSALSSDKNVERYPRTGCTITSPHPTPGVLSTTPLGPSEAAACYNVIPRNENHGSVY